MQIGIFAKTFARSSVEDVFAAVAEHGLPVVQFNLSCCGLASMPEQIPEGVARRVREAARAHKIDIAAVSGTFNMIHLDADRRRDGLRRLSVLAAAAREMGTRVITLCTGTRDADDMWRPHPENDSDAAWTDLVASMTEAVRIAGAHDLILAIEPEISNTVDCADKARRLIDELGSPPG